MVEVENKEFYHVHSPLDLMNMPNKNADQWTAGNSILFGSTPEDTNALHDRIFKTELNVGDYKARLKWITNHRNRSNSGMTKSEMDQEFFQCSVLFKSLLIARETILEEVRHFHYPNKPSRLTGIWLCDFSELKLWSKIFQQNTNVKVFKIEFSGKIHKADARWIKNKSLSFDYYYKNAIGYWSGDLRTNKWKPDTEYIGNGEVKIIEELDLKKSLIGGRRRGRDL